MIRWKKKKKTSRVSFLFCCCCCCSHHKIYSRDDWKEKETPSGVTSNDNNTIRQIYKKIRRIETRTKSSNCSLAQTTTIKTTVAKTLYSSSSLFSPPVVTRAFLLWFEDSFFDFPVFFSFSRENFFSPFRNDFLQKINSLSSSSSSKVLVLVLVRTYSSPSNNNRTF